MLAQVASMPAHGPNIIQRRGTIGWWWLRSATFGGLNPLPLRWTTCSGMGKADNPIPHGKDGFETDSYQQGDRNGD